MIFPPVQKLEQENYSLKMKLECQQVSSSSLQQELEVTLAQLEKEQVTREKRLGEIHSKKILELTLLNDDSKAEIGKLSVSWSGNVPVSEFLVFHHSLAPFPLLWLSSLLKIFLHSPAITLCAYPQVQVKTLQERVQKQEGIIEQLRAEASCREDATTLHNELLDLENIRSSGKKGGGAQYTGVFA